MERITKALGLAILYASAYFLPLLNPYSLYFIPSFSGYVVIPSLISVIVLAPLFLLVSTSIVRTGCRRALVYIGTIILTVIAAKSTFDAAGYPWAALLGRLTAPAHASPSLDFRSGRAMVVGIAALCALALVQLNRHRLSKLLKFHSALGYSFLFLAVYRCLSGDLALRDAGQANTTTTASAPASSEAARRVVWVIFDEFDYGLAFGANAKAASQLPTFSRLASQSVNATDAYAPGRDTVYSIPSLLTGTAITGVRFDRLNQLNLRDQRGVMLPFVANSSLFARLPGGPGSATLLGFYHPYCKTFPGLQRCHSTYLANAGRWFDGLAFFSEAIFSTLRHWNWAVQNVPEWLLAEFDPMYRATSDVLSRLDETLQNPRSSLDFIHVNVPHLPNVYVQRLMHQPVSNDTDAYRQNLAGADLVLGRIVQHLGTAGKKRNTLLIVSSDHWLRTHSQRPANVPFFAWTVGTHTGQQLSEPLSTVHSAQLALDFLNGKVDSQSEIADFLRQAPLYPTWIAPDGYRYY